MADARLLLFDIDGTLLDTGGAGLNSLRQGFEDAFGDEAKSKPFPPLDLAGATDGGVARFLFDHYELTLEPEAVESFYSRYHFHLEAHLAENALRLGRVLPGIPELLRRLTDDSPHALGLLTGNIARGAWTKVESYDLGGIFDFGAFGDDHHDRNELGPIARQRASEATGRVFADGDVWIIGDTPKDIACARACGAVAVAVATGSYSREALAEHEPDHLFDDFADPEVLIELLKEDSTQVSG